MTESPPDEGTIEHNHDCRLLRQLRATPQIFSAIAAAGSESSLRIQEQLRQDFEAELVRAALSVYSARQRAEGPLPHADRLWLTRVGLEQSTAWAVARHKASRFPDGGVIQDLCCGIGVDAAALAHRSSVEAVDSDPATCLRCEWNLDIWSPPHTANVRCGDVTRHDWKGDIVHIDPDRRAGRDRPVRRIEQYQPPLEWLQELCRNAAGGGIKLGPAANFLQKFPDCEIELISLDGECREATVWFGSLSSEHPFRATVLPSGETLCGDPLSAMAPRADDIGSYVFDPDPAVVRSGLVDMLAEQQSLQRLDAEEEYLTGDTLPESCLVSGFRVLEILPHSRKDLRRAVRSAPASNYEVKCRHLTVNAADVQRSLPRGDGPPRVVLFLRHRGKARIVLAERMDRSGR